MRIQNPRSAPSQLPVCLTVEDCFDVNTTSDTKALQNICVHLAQRTPCAKLRQGAQQRYDPSHVETQTSDVPTPHNTAGPSLKTNGEDSSMVTALPYNLDKVEFSQIRLLVQKLEVVLQSCGLGLLTEDVLAVKIGFDRETTKRV